jgi:hypothetical protein
MSFLTGTNVETIYASEGVGIAKNTFTTEITINDTATMGVQAHLPPDFWLPSKGQVGRGIHISAHGLLGVVTAGSPTFTFSIRFGAAGNTSSAIVLGSAAITMSATALSNIPFVLEGDIILEAIGAAGNNSTVRGLGYIWSPIIASQGTGLIGGMAGLFGGGATPGTVATVDTSITNYINFNVACSASNGSNAVQLQQLLVYGLN